MKTYRLEKWDMLGCPDGGGHCHVGGQIYGHPEIPDGSWAMSDKVVFFDNEKRQAQTLTSGLVQLGEMSTKMAAKQQQLRTASKADGSPYQDAAGQPFTAMLHDDWVKYDPSEWTVRGGTSNSAHQGIEDAGNTLNDLLQQVFGREGAPDKKRKH